MAAQLLLGGTAPRHWSSDADARSKRDLLLSKENREFRWSYLLRQLATWKG